MGSCLFKTFRWDLKWDVLFETFETCNFSNPSWGVAYLKLSDETSNKIFYLKFLKLETFQIPSWGVAYLKLSDETWNEMCYLKLLKLETFQTFKPITGVGYLKHSDKTWYEMCYLKFWNILTFSNSSWELLIWNFQMRLQTRYSIWNFETWNFSNMSWELLIWNFQMRLWNKLETSQTCHGSCLFETFRWDLKLETFQTFPSWGVAYLKLSDETWNKIFYLKCLKLVTSQTHVMGSCLFETFRWDLKWEVLFQTFETCHFSNTCHGELLIWNFQMRLEMRCAILKLLKLVTFQTHVMGSCLFETFRWDLKKRCYLKFLKLVTFQIHHGELLI